MPRRPLALLLIFLLGLQAVIVTSFGSPLSTATSMHCDDVADGHAGNDMDMNVCPCCADVAASGCAAHCITMFTSSTDARLIVDGFRHENPRAITALWLSRAAIPPTPPPIA